MAQGAAVSFSEAAKPNKRHGRWWKILLAIVVLLVIIRLILPYFVLKYVNKTLSEVKTYPGSVRDIDLALIRGAYVIKDIRLDKRDSVTGKLDSIPFFTSSRIDLSVEWSALFKGSVVGEIVVEDPKVYFVKGKHKNENVKQDTSDFKDVIRDLMPLQVNRFEINNGEIHYADPFSSPKIDILLSNIQAVATNLRNTNDSTDVMPAGLKATADVYSGKMEMNMKFDPLNKVPTFDMNARVEAVDLTKLNDFFRAYAKFSVKSGGFGLYTEFAAKDRKFKGYVKPLIHDLKVEGLGDKDANLGQKLWESVVGVVAEVFENQPKDQLATRIPIEGSFDDAKISIWDAVVYVLRNAFVHALQPSIEQTIDIGKVAEVEEKKSFFGKVFGKKKDKDGEEKDGKKDRRERGK